MLIGEIVKKAGVSKDTVRFYEKIGLITIPKKARRDNNYKEYPENIVKRLNVIQQLKNFGFTLNEIQEIICIYEADLSVCIENLPKVHSKIKLIDEKIKQLNLIKEQLSDCIKNCPESCDLEKTLSNLKNEVN